MLRSARNDRYAFTLSEVLITLGIIGVVAALTLPNIIADHREKQTIVKLKKTYNILNDAVSMMISEHGNLNEWQDDSIEFFRQELKKHLNIVKTCNPYRCSGLTDQGEVYVLNNGTAIQVTYRKTNVYNTGHHCASSLSIGETHYTNCVDIKVDINGKARPNKAGEDLFQFSVYTDGVVPKGRKHSHSNDGFDQCMYSIQTHYTCAAWVIYNENMDYLRCFDKLNYDVGPYSCEEAEKNGNK